MAVTNRVYWSATATFQFLELEEMAKEKVDYCVDLIKQFYLVGTRLVTTPGEHRRRFVCGGFRIVYDLKETRLADLIQESTEPLKAEPPGRVEITIRRLRHA